MQNASREFVERVIEVGIVGEQRRGDNGAVLVDAETNDIVYLLSHEFQPLAFQNQLNELLSEDNQKHIFIVHKDKDAMHISKIPKGI